LQCTRGLGKVHIILLTLAESGRRNVAIGARYNKVGFVWHWRKMMMNICVAKLHPLIRIAHHFHTPVLVHPMQTCSSLSPETIVPTYIISIARIVPMPGSIWIGSFRRGLYFPHSLGRLFGVIGSMGERVGQASESFQWFPKRSENVG
jgi:hypothetical protein